MTHPRCDSAAQWAYSGRLIRLTCAPCNNDIGGMREIDPQTAEDYLRHTKKVAPDEAIRVRELTGGVSNMVMLVERPDVLDGDFVLKQARPRLRTRIEWRADVRRIWREADVLRHCARLLDAQRRPPDGPAANVPRIVFEDRDNYILAIQAAPHPHSVWKSDLLAGRVDDQVARSCGWLLGTLHARSWLDAQIAEQLGDRRLFDELRVDPYYRTLAATQPEVRPKVEHLIQSMEHHPCALVHADFSPKNLLVYENGLMMVDFETGHYGDPAFDLGFFLSHLVLKACAKAPVHDKYLVLADEFVLEYDQIVGPRVGTKELARLWTRGLQNLAGCAWARLDGKSPVEYLDDPPRRRAIRDVCRELFAEPPDRWSQVRARCCERFAKCAREAALGSTEDARP